MPNPQDIPIWAELLRPMPVVERLAAIAKGCATPVFTTSLGKEDQYLTWSIAGNAPDIRIVTLNTGRLFDETLSLLADTRTRYGLAIEEFAPDPEAVDAYVRDHGVDGIYDSIAQRKACCGIRKVAPLGRALAGADGWITGLRRDQSDERATVPYAEWDEARGLIKFNPLADVAAETIEAAVTKHDIPVNALHARGYPSIGCAPCTRAVRSGEHERAGRWWWEQNQSQECGLHVSLAAPSPLEAETRRPHHG